MTERRIPLREWPWALAIAFGAALRGFRLLSQVPVDDEWHSIHRLVSMEAAEVALSFGIVDHCIPLTLYAKAAAATIGLHDWVLRLPSFAAGVLAVWLLPWLARRHLGRSASWLFAWLLALSPLLVLYGRLARPYEIALVLSFTALALFERWWEDGRRAHALGYGACAAVASWFLLAVLPFVAAPLLVGGAAALRERRAGGVARLATLALPAAAWLGFSAVLLLPPLLHHPEAVLAKLGSVGPEPAALGRAAGFLLGTPSLTIGVLLVALAGFGAVRLTRRAPIFVALHLGGTALLGFALFVSAPGYGWLGFVSARYLLPALPVLLACVSVAFDGPGRGRPLAAAALCALLLWTGRVPAVLLDTRAWFPARWITQMEGSVAEAARVPEFYRELGSRPPGSVVLVEAPWYYSLWNNLLPFYERIHRQHTLVGFTNGLCSRLPWGEYPPESGVRLDSFVSLADSASLRERGVDYVVLHRDLASEMARVVDPVDVRATWQPDASRCVDALRERGWEEVFHDASIQVLAAPST